jgi:hypothetical protein
MAELHFDEETHSYTLDGKPVPSVTQILDAVVPKPFQAAMYYGYRLARQGIDPEEKRNASAQLGTQVHLAFADLAAGEDVDPFDYPDEAAGFIGGLRKFIDTHGPEFLDSERKTYSVKHQYAGTLDAHVRFTRGKYKGRTARIDLKTGRYYPDSHNPQLEAYELAEVEQGQDPTDFRAVLKVTPGGTHKLIVSTDTADDWLVLKAHFDSIQRRSDRTKRSRSE